jgi:hypothetical protein
MRDSDIGEKRPEDGSCDFDWECAEWNEVVDEVEERREGAAHVCGVG